MVSTVAYAMVGAVVGVIVGAVVGTMVGASVRQPSNVAIDRSCAVCLILGFFGWH